MTHPEVDYTPEERRALLAAVPQEPLSEERLQSTLQRARQLRGVGGALRRHRRPLIVAAAAALIAALGAAGAWRWDGHHSDRDLTLAKAIRVIDNPLDHDVEGVRAALGKIRRDLSTTLTHMHATGSLTPEVRQRVLDAIENTPPSSARYSGPFEAIKERAVTSRLSLAEQDAFVDAMRAGVGALKQGVVADPRHRRIVDVMLRRLRESATEPDGGKQ